MSLRIVTFAEAELQTRQNEIVAIYRDAFTPPPYNKLAAEIAEFAHSFPTQWQRDAYRFVAALEGDSEQPVGFAYGYASAAGRWWVGFVQAALGEPLASTWLSNSFQLVEIAVTPAFQGQGIGAQLHDSLLTRLPHDRALLGTMQADTVAYRFYRRRGWDVLAENLDVPGIARRYQIMGLELSTRRPPVNQRT